jgi:two-component sensor histidine kinase
LRIQTRRTEEKTAKMALTDATNRILSVAVIHEFLSDNDAWAINMKDVSQRVVVQIEQSLIAPGVNIQFKLEGPSIWLPARQATACALVINELLQNAVEHAFRGERSGLIGVNLIDEGDYVIITISDDGAGLPENFDPTHLSSLGLQIARTLVTEDLQGSFDLLTNPHGGTTAKITFPKALFEQEVTDFG